MIWGNVNSLYIFEVTGIFSLTFHEKHSFQNNRNKSELFFVWIFPLNWILNTDVISLNDLSYWHTIRIILLFCLLQLIDWNVLLLWVLNENTLNPVKIKFNTMIQFRHNLLLQSMTFINSWIINTRYTTLQNTFNNYVIPKSRFNSSTFT